MGFVSSSPILTFEPRRLEGGFTLVELLVVMVVMGIALSLVMVQLMPDDKAILREEAARLALLLENAGLEARASGHSMAWSAEGNRYLFWQKNEYNDWTPIEEGTSFRPRNLPEGIQITDMTVEELPFKRGEQLALSASAFALPFKIRLSYASAIINVVGKSTGEVNVIP
jgi:general secretion pathway protein H